MHVHSTLNKRIRYNSLAAALMMRGRLAGRLEHFLASSHLDTQAIVTRQFSIWDTIQVSVQPTVFPITSITNLTLKLKTESLKHVNNTIKAVNER